jgi:uncharacterized protein YdaU (DUF1376 family)
MSLPRMSLHIGDYRRDTGHLRAAGHGAYLLLIMHYWATGGLPDDDRQLAVIAGLSDREWRAMRPVLEKFFQPGWKHKRIDAELAEAHDKYERRASAGKRGGEAKAASNATAMLQQTASNPNPNPNPQDRGVREETAPGLIAPETFALADQIFAAIGVDRDDPRWAGTAMRVQSWRNQGWAADAILAAIRKVMAGRTGPPDSIRYFEKAIARQVAEHNAPVPVMEPHHVQTIAARRRSGNGFVRNRVDRARSRAGVLPPDGS